MIVGERLRDTRHALHLSLTDVAEKAGISAATLSRIETHKQGIDLALFLTLAKILRVVPHELLGEPVADKPAPDPIVKKIVSLAAAERARMWRELAAARRNVRRRQRRPATRDLSQQVEEVVAQFEYLHQEIESVRNGLKRLR
ncbi:MAG: hypothetical protein NVSMB68_08330 [Thermoanaerobaculia bacterium]